MKRDTEKRIASYKKALPRIREKGFAAGLALLLSAIIAVSATFAWVTLSRAPEVSAVATTLAANGALEIALSKPDGSEPSDADFDESVGLSTDVTVTNLQWGNLINISDASYGIDDLELRPAQLNTGSLATSPLYGAVYGADGRVEKLSSQYTYATWDSGRKLFLASGDRGVRAISSYTVESLGVDEAAYADFEARYAKVLSAHTEVGTAYYGGLTGTIGGLGDVMSTYLQSKLNEKGYGTGDKNIPLTTAQLQAVCTTHDALCAAMEKECDALVALANLQQYVFAKQNGADGVDLPYSEVTWETLKKSPQRYDRAGEQHKTGDAVKEPADAISLTDLIQFVKDYNTAAADNKTLRALVEKSNGGTTVYSNEIDGPVNHLVNPGKGKIDGKTFTEWMAGSKFDLLPLKSGDHLVTLCDGLLKRFEQIASDNRLPASTKTSANAAPVSARASYKGIPLDINMTGHLCTDASGASSFQQDFGKLPTAAELTQANKVAEDTYGMAVDFWIRSNHESTYLTLEGATTIDESGNVLRYDGKNRVWGATGNTALTTDSTTQGGGSCYVYYADTPEDMQRSLDLMEFMKVAFVSQDGTLLAKANMDTEHYLAVNGRVTVPLVISQIESEKYTVKLEDDTEETRYAIKHMKLDEKTLITAIIYIDGDNLQNTQVLSAANIQGQLNLQFSSSEQMTTVGDNKLLTAERYVTASVSKKSFDFDAPDGDLTTRVTVEVEGSDPQTVEAFFVRAVNNSQGQRCEPIAFTKQTDGSWTGDYIFELPGVYYLRYVRLDRVDYALAEPCRVDVSGFAVSAVDWSEGLANAKEYYTTESSYAESVSIKFAGTEGSRVPTSVQARFIRDDGNAVNIDTKYNAAKSAWEGTGVFTASGNYTLSYLILDGNYYDISQFAKTLNLHMGLRAAVYNKNSSLMDEFDSQNPQLVRNKNVQVSILDSSGQRISELKGLKLYYTSGSGGANTVDTDLTWGLSEKDESGQISIVETGYYEGTLPLINAGRYRFYQLRLDTQNTITSVTEAPVYTIVPPNTPEYDATSASEYNGQQVNFMPLKANATMGPLRISDSAAAELAAVVYNSATGEYYDIPKADVQSLSGTMYYVNEGGGYWKLNLPTYEKDGKTIQDGTWQLVCLKLWNCFDGTTNQDNYRTDKNPLIWCGSTEEAAAYMTREKLTADQTLDFSKLSTTVSCTVNVAMEPGQTVLGDKNADFMTQYKVSELGMSVSITDDAGRTIPANKLGEVKLTVNYAGNSGSNVAVYGYEVKGTAPTHSIIMAQQANGSWTPRSQDNIIWQYVGEYKVSDLSVSVGGTTQSFPAGEHGVPEMYTITSKAPTAANLEIKSAKLDQTEFGKSNGAVTGAFLASYSPKVTVDMTFSPLDVSGQMYAVVPDMSVTVDYQYQNGTSAPNGGYSWTGYTDYESYTDTCSTPTVSGGKYSFIASGSKTLLAGRYAVSGTLHWKEDGREMTKSVGNLGSINVWSVQPTVTVTGVSPTGPVTVNPAGGTAATTDNLFRATNHSGPAYASVYMAYDVSTKNGTYNGNEQTNEFASRFADYTAPTMGLKIEKAGNFDTVFEAVGASQTLTARFTPSNPSATVSVGKITTGTDTSCVKTVTTTDTKTGQTTTNDYPVSNETESAEVFGVATVTAVKTTFGGATYTRELTKPITISQTNQQAPKLTYQTAAGMTITVENAEGGLGYASGSMVDGMTALRITATAGDGYYDPRISQPAGALNWTVVSEEKLTAQYTCNMAFVDMSMSGTVRAYPKLTWTAGNAGASVEVRAGEKVLTSGANVEPGTEITVTAAAKSDAGYCQPRIATGSGWTKNEGDYVSTYTFAMPQAATAIPAPTYEKMYRVSWENTTALTITAVDHNENGRPVNSDVSTVDSDDYVIPGHTVIITVTADGGTNPRLTQPTDAVSYGSTASAFIRQYSITMPRQDVTIVATSDPYPLLTFANAYADITLKSNDAEVSTEGVSSKGIKPDNTVTITLTAKSGYYAPRMTAPAGITEFKTVGTPDNRSATYSFKMPNQAVDAAGRITASTAKTVKFESGQTTMSIAGKNYDGSAIASGSGAQVQPDTIVTVTVRSKSGYYNPTVSGGGAAETSRTGYDTATYTFTMGTSDVTLTGGGTADPKLTVVNNGTSIEVKANGAEVSSGGSIHPGSTVTVTATPDATHYAPRVSADGVSDLAATGTPGQNSAAYTFTMGTSPVTLRGTASAKRQLSWSATGVRFTVKVGGLPVDSGAYVIPGQEVSVSVQNESGWVDGKVTSSDVTIAASGGKFTMPDKNVTLTGTASPTLKWIKGSAVTGSASVKYGTTEGNYPVDVSANTNVIVPVGSYVEVKIDGKTTGKWWNRTYYGGYMTNITGMKGIITDSNKDGDIKITHQPEINNLTGEYRFQMPEGPVTFTADVTNDASVCVSEDTMITLADGTQKRVDELTGSEMLLTWNHKTGSYDTAPIAYLIDHGGVRQEQPITHLFFADGSDLEIIGEHVFYNADTGKYITLDENAADYIGTHFAKQNTESGGMERVALTDVKHEVKLTGIYEVVTNGYMTCFTDGILTASAYIDKLLNTFDIETDTMAYNPFKVIADIQTYGLYTYEDLQELGLTEAQFNMHNAALLKIAVGKGTLTWQDMSDLMDMFREYANEMPAAETNVQPNSMAEELPKMFGAYFAAKGQQAVDSVGKWAQKVFN